MFHRRLITIFLSLSLFSGVLIGLNAQRAEAHDQTYLVTITAGGQTKWFPQFSIGPGKTHYYTQIAPNNVTCTWKNYLVSGGQQFLSQVNLKGSGPNTAGIANGYSTTKWYQNSVRCGSTYTGPVQVHYWHG